MKKPAFYLSAFLLSTVAPPTVAEATPVPGAEGPEGGEAVELSAGPAVERTITATERHAYRVRVSDRPLLVRVEQRGIDLTVETEGPDGRAVTDAGFLRWAPEVVLLETPGDHRVEVRAQDPEVAPGRYGIRVESLEPADGDRIAALRAMSRAGREAAERTPEARQRAKSSSKEALALWRLLGERRREAECLDALGALAAEDRELVPAIESYSLALSLWRELGDRQREAASLNEIGLNRHYTGETEKAREAFSASLALWQALGERLDEAQTRGNLCALEIFGGALSSALSCYQATLSRFRQYGDESHTSRLLSFIGGVYSEMGEPDAALVSYREALDLARAGADRRGEARILNNIAVVQRAVGEWQEALRIYAQVREILTSLGDRLQQGALLSNIGSAYVDLGQPERALAVLEDALKLRREVGDRRGEVTTLNHLGGAWRRLGDLPRALLHHRRALEVAQALTDRRLEALTRVQLGEVLFEQGDAAGALAELSPASESLRAMDLVRYEARAVALRGRALALAGRPAEAREALELAAARCRELREQAREAEALQALAGVERTLGLAEPARAHAAGAVALVERLRTGFVSPDLRAAFLATQRRAYSLSIELWMDRHAGAPDAGHDRTALELSERARARSLADVLYSDSLPDEGGAPAALLDRRRSLRRRMSALADQQLKKSGERAEALGRELETLAVELDGVEAEVRRQDPRYAATSAPPTLTAAETADLLDPDTLLLEYSLGPESGYLWAVGPGTFRSFVLPPEREIEALVRPLYDQLSTVEAGSRRDPEPAETLSRWLLAPAWPEAAAARRLVVVPDGALHFLPFAALPAPDSGRPLLERHEVSYLPSATTLALARERLRSRPPAGRWAAVFADPVFAAADPRLRAGAPPAAEGIAANPDRDAEAGALLEGLERLPSSLREAEAIAGLAPPGAVWTALGPAASREAVLSSALDGFRVLHFATHALAHPRSPQLSGLVLSLYDAAGRSRAGLLTVPEIYELHLGADLVVLSGCRTALGKEVWGEGLMSLTRGFLYAGSPRVLASLWRVQDRTAAELMRRFYHAYWQEGLPAAAALTAAQRSLARDPRYRAPHSWAAFVLQGDWR